MNEFRSGFRRMTQTDLDERVCWSSARSTSSRGPSVSSATASASVISAGSRSTAAIIVGHAVISVTAGESHMLNLSIAGKHQRKGGQAASSNFSLAKRAAATHTPCCSRCDPAIPRRLTVIMRPVSMKSAAARIIIPRRAAREDALMFARHIPPRSNPSAVNTCNITGFNRCRILTKCVDAARLRSFRIRTPARPRSPKNCCCSARRSRWPARSRAARRRDTRPRTGWSWKNSAASRSPRR